MGVCQALHKFRGRQKRYILDHTNHFGVFKTDSVPEDDFDSIIDYNEIPEYLSWSKNYGVWEFFKGIMVEQGATEKEANDCYENCDLMPLTLDHLYRFRELINDPTSAIYTNHPYNSHYPVEVRRKLCKIWGEKINIAIELTLAGYLFAYTCY